MLRVEIDDDMPLMFCTKKPDGEVYSNMMTKEEAAIEAETYNAGWAAAMGIQKE
jgi:hypothetical protein